MTTEKKRQRLIDIANGKQQHYCIEYCVDIKGNLTILGGDELPEHTPYNILMPWITEDYIWLFSRLHGDNYARREMEANGRLTHQQIVNAFMEFRQQHPHDGYGMQVQLEAAEGGQPDSSRRAERDDIAEVRAELKRRNRQYIAELYGVTLPLDYDFKAEYDKAMRTQ